MSADKLSGNNSSRDLLRQARLAALVIGVTAVAWLAANWLGRTYGLAGRYAVLLDLAALASFVWALVVTVRIWRIRRAN